MNFVLESLVCYVKLSSFWTLLFLGSCSSSVELFICLRLLITSL